MMQLMISGGLGLLFGMAVQACGLARAQGVRKAAGLSRSTQMQTWLYTLGIGMVLTALLCYLAVIDVDRIDVLPLHGGVLVGGLVLGVGIGLGGATPGTLLCGLGGGGLLRSICGVLGAAAGLAAARALPFERLKNLTQMQQGTLFRLTLVDPWLLEGRFMGLACLGAVFCVLALLVRPQREPEGSADAVMAQPRKDDGMSEETKASADDGTISGSIGLADESQQDEEPADELIQLDVIQDEVEDIDAADEAELHAALAQAAVADADPVLVDDLLPELEPLPGCDDAWLNHQQQERPSPMEDEALDELTPHGEG